MNTASWMSRSLALMNLSLVAYALAWFAHLLAAFRPDERETRDPKDRLHTQVAIALGVGAWMAHTLSVACRWAGGGWGHAPWTSLFEVLLTFSWILMSASLLLHWRQRLRWNALLVIPLVALAVYLARINPNRGIELLGPSLQSRWLFVHVPAAAAGYGLLLVASAISFFHLIKDQVSTDRLQLGGSALGLAIFAWIVGVDAFGPVTSQADSTGWVPGASASLLLAVGVGAWLVHWTVGSFAAALMASGPVGKTRGVSAGYLGAPGERLEWLNFGLRGFFALGALAILGFCVTAAVANGRVPGFRIAHHPYRFGGMLLSAVIALILLLAGRWRVWLEKKLPAPEQLDRWSYQSTVWGFLLLTGTLVTGAAWADQVWGSYWSWDPKETWTLVTWLFYAIYLHNRLISSWTARKAAVLSLLGAVVVLFTFLGVNLLISGVHAFATG